MSLTAGARLGPYEIVSPLGAGGMGEVYRAKDGRLNRTVAIKILSDESAADADRRERFEREAKAISALDHPNICALYDVGEHEGTYFLVMPCLEGQTLADRIGQRRRCHLIRRSRAPSRSPRRSTPRIATASSIATLKPGNIMLTKTGVKLLDFGLAKLKKAPGPLGDTTMVKGTGIGTSARAPCHTWRRNRSRAATSMRERHLLARRGDLRNGHGPARVQGRLARQRDRRDPEGRTGADEGTAAADAVGVRSRGDDVPGQGPG
jgi:serine/threonine protein kinase